MELVGVAEVYYKLALLLNNLLHNLQSKVIKVPLFYIDCYCF